MALDDKNILITPNTGTANEPKIEFTGADGSGNDTITLSASYDGSVSTLSFEASTGQLFSVANIDSDGDGYSFSINDQSGIPAVLVELDGTIQLNPNTGNVLIGTATDDGSNLLQVNGNTKLTGDVSGIADLYIDDQIISTGDTNTYLQFHAADQFRIVTGGTERLEVKNTNPVVLVTGNLKVEGNIEATGTLDTTGQNDLAVSDRKITLNDGETAAGVNGGTGGELAVSGIFIDRGTLDSASFVFDESDDKWKARLNTAFDTPALATLVAATLEGNLDWSYIQSKPDPVVTVTLTGDVTGTGNATLTNLGDGTISFATTIAANSVALGTDTTGAYVADIVQGDAISISETANNAEGNVVTINHADTSTVGNLSSDNSNGTVLQDISFTFDTYGHVTAASVATTNLDNRYIRSFQVEDGDGTEVTINQANEWKFVEGTGDGASIDINWTDTSNGTDADPYDLTFSVTNTDKGSAQNIFKTFTITDTDTGYSYTDTGSAVADTNSDTLTFVSGNDFDIDVDATNDAIRFQHVDITRTDTTSNTSPAYGGTFTVIDSLTTNARGHVTAANVKTVTVPASDNTNTTYDLSIIQTGGTDDNPAIRLAAGGSGSGNDDLTLTGGDAITITRTSATGLTVAHSDTSTQGSVNNSGNTFVQDITLDTHGHITAITSATTSIGDATITIAGGNDLQNSAGAFTTNQTGNETITINHSDITRTDTTSTGSPAYGGTFTVIDGITTNARGHVTAANVKTVTVPASDNTNTTYSISTVAGDDASSEKIRLTAGGSGSGNDDIILAVAQTGSTDGLDISESGDTITFAHHDTSTLSGVQGSTGIASVTVDEMGHVTAVSTATYNNYVHPAYTGRTITVNTSGVDVLDTLNITVDTIGSVTVANAATRTLPNASSTVAGVVSTGTQYFGGTKLFAGDILPSLDNQRNVGTAGNTWASGHFTNFTIDNILNIRGVIDFLDNDYMRMGTGDDYFMYFNGSDLIIHQNVGGKVLITDTSDVTKFNFDPTNSDFTIRGASGGESLILENTTTSSDWDVGDLHGNIRWSTESDIITEIECRQTLENQTDPYGGFVVNTGNGSVTPERMVIDHNGCITMVAGGTTASSTLSFLADPSTSDDRINLSLQQEFRRTTGAADLGAAVVLSGVAKYALANDQDSDLFTIIGSTNTNPRYFANASISLYKPAGAEGKGGIKFSTGSHNFISPSTLTERMRIDQDGNVGIGIVPDSNSKLHVQDTTSSLDDYTIHIESYTPAVVFHDISAASTDFAIQADGSALMFRYGDASTGTQLASEAMRIDASGNVGIGQAPAALFHVVEADGGAPDAIVRIQSNDTANSKALLQFLGRNNSNVATYATVHTDAVGAGTNAPIVFSQGASEANERMRIDENGDILLQNASPEFHFGTTSATHYNWRIAAQEVVDNGFEIASGTTSLGSGALADTYTPRFTILGDTGWVGIGVNNPTAARLSIQQDDASGQIAMIRSGSATIVMNNSGNQGLVSGGWGPSVDNSIDLGRSDKRWDDIFATNNIIQTSDRNEKQDIEALSDAEQRVAVAAKGLLRKFRWKSSVAEKGDEARIHFGIIAQDLQDAFTAEGLDAGRYAMFVNSPWKDEETGEEGTRMGVRYSELLAFIISAI